jgi:hypothetical protein
MHDDPDPVAAVVGADSRSRYNDRPAGVAALTQVSEYPVKATRQTDDSRHVLKKTPTGSSESNNSRKFRPEIAVIAIALLLASGAEGLAGEAAGEEVKPASSKVIALPSVRPNPLPFPCFALHAARRFSSCSASIVRISLAEGVGQNLPLSLCPSLCGVREELLSATGRVERRSESAVGNGLGVVNSTSVERLSPY